MRALEVVLRGLARMHFRSAVARGPETRGFETLGFALAVLPMIVKAALAAATGALPEQRGLAGFVAAALVAPDSEALAPGLVGPEVAELVPAGADFGRPVPEWVAVLVVVFAEVSLVRPAWPGSRAGQSLRP